MFFSGGRGISVIGQSFDLVQTATMDVVGIGQSVSTCLLCVDDDTVVRHSAVEFLDFDWSESVYWFSSTIRH